jgi:iron complex outermembrane receptor protein/vitamin B12 transporter
MTIFSLRAACRLFCVFLLFASASLLHAVNVHGTVTDSLGKPIAGAAVSLIHNGKVVVTGVTGYDGGYSLMSADSGRFYVLASGHSFRQLATQSFYSNTLDSVQQNIVLEPAWVRQSVVVTATGEPQPQAQVTASVSEIGATQLENKAGIVDALRQVPGLNVVQTGERGGVTSLFIRGGSSTANRVTLDGVPIEDIGGRFDFGNIATTGLAHVEVYRGPNSVLYGSDASAGVVALTTPQGSTQFPSLLYEGDAGNFGTYRNEVQLGGMKRRLDYYGGFSSLQTSNSIPMDTYHDDTSAANIGWSWTSKTEMRITARNSDSATGLPSGNSGYEFYGIANDQKESDQDTYGTLTITHTFRDNLSSTVRYGLVRKREESQQWYPAGELLGGNYYGREVTVTGANGYSVTGRALLNYGTASGSVYPWSLALASNRDNLYANVEYQHGPHLGMSGAFRFENERGVENEPAYAFRRGLERTNYDYQGQVGGEFANRLFYSAAGGVEDNGLFGLVGTPRMGVSYYLVRPGKGVFHGTKLSFNFARGYQEPTLDQQSGSLYAFLIDNGGQATAAKYGIAPISEEQSRSYDGGVTQSLFSEKVILKVTYFHNEFGNQIEAVPASLVPTLLPNLSAAQQQQLESFLNNNYAYELDLNSMAYQAQGVESEVQYGLGQNVYIRAGYTYLDPVVQHSFSSDAVGPSYNPKYPGIPIGNYSPLVGARPFRLAPHTGFTSVVYTGKKWTAVLDGAYSSRSDDSTFLGGTDVNFGNTMLLPNRNLDFGYAKLDAGVTYRAKPWMSLYTQMDNLTSDQHIGPIGYPSLPFSFRTGMRLKLHLGAL